MRRFLLVLLPASAVAAPPGEPAQGPTVAIDHSGDFISRGLPIEVFTAHATSRLGAVRACYGMVLEDAPGTGGKLIAMLDLSRTGAVEKVTMKLSELANPDLEYCALDALSKKDFPAAPDNLPLQVRYTLVFTPGPPADAGETAAAGD